MLFGGLEIVAAGVVVHEYNKNKREKREQQRIQEEEEDYRRAEEERRRRRRRHSASNDQRPPRPSKQDDYKYGYKPATNGPSQGHYSAKPAAAVTGLYGATLAAPAPPNGKYNYVGPSSSNLNVPAGPMRPSSAPGVQRYDQRPGGPPAYAPPYNSAAPPQAAPYHAPAPPSQYGPPRPQAQTNYAPPQPPQPYQPHLVPYIPGQYQTHTQQQQQQPSQPQNQGWAPDEKYPLPPPEQDLRRRSNESLPLGIYEESVSHNYAAPPHGTHEMSAEGPWMHDDHRTAHQSPHVRFRLPGEGRVVGTGERASIAMVNSPPPAYRP